MCQKEWTNFLGHTPGLGYELSDPHDVGGHVVDRLLILNNLQLVQQGRNKQIQVLHCQKNNEEKSTLNVVAKEL